MFDEEPDGDPHGECAAEIHRLMADLAAAQRELAAWKQAVYSFERGEYPGADSGIADHVAELLARVVRYGDKVRFI